MDDARFDRLARGVVRPTRRGLLAAVAAIAVAPADPAGAKRKPDKPKAECQFAKNKGVWRLKKNCTITKPLRIPANVLLNGAGNVVKPSGRQDSYGSAGVVVGSASNLVVDGSKWTPASDCDTTPVPLILASKTLDRVAAVNLQCGVGILAKQAADAPRSRSPTAWSRNWTGSIGPPWGLPHSARPRSPARRSSRSAASSGASAGCR